MFTRIMSQAPNKFTSLTPKSKKIIPKWYKTAVTLKTWGMSGMAFGVTGFVLLCYFTEWRAVLQYVPYYNGKFKQLELEEQIKEIKEKADMLESKENSEKSFNEVREDKLMANIIK